MSASPKKASETPGHKVGKVSLDISYEIIEHFSRNLYSSPNKAIEELVVNGFDAAATRVHVFLPSEHVTKHVLVWDNGYSMDEKGLEELWKLSDSPKKRMADRTVATREGHARKIIGKFGIGKLASYILGDEISHLCKTEGGRYFLVRVDYREITETLTGEERAPYTSPILELTEQEAETFLAEYFEKRPPAFDLMFEETSWTVAVISDLKREDLHSSRLRWVLGHSMPLRPDFEVLVNLEKVVPKLLRTELRREWKLDDSEVVQALKAVWNKDDLVGDADSELKFGSEKGLDPNSPDEDVPYVKFPNLDKVWGVCRFYENSLERKRDPLEQPVRNHGYFVMVRNRLVNTDDEKLFIGDPTFGVFYRSQFILHIDALDENLLADRERFLRDERKTRELRLLQVALYSVARDEKDRFDKELTDQASPTYRLPMLSRLHFVEPLNAHLTARPDRFESEGVTYEEMGIEYKPLEGKSGLAELSPDGKTFEINTGHPYYEAISKAAGGGKRGGQVKREFELLAISEFLFEGHLIDLGLPLAQVDEIVRWRDDMYKILAQGPKTSVEELAEELKEASHKGSKAFESAIRKVLEHMGFIAEAHGASGEKDVLMRAPAKEGGYKITFEAKGKKKPTSGADALANDAAEVGGAAAHRDAVDAEHAVIVARKFAGFERQGDKPPAILKECLSVAHVSIMEIEALIRLMQAMDRYAYPLDMVKEVFTAIESPDEKSERIDKLTDPFENFDYRQLLEDIWREQDEYYDNEPVSYYSLYHKTYKNKYGSLTMDDFGRKLAALSTLANGRIVFDETGRTVKLLQSPATMAERIERHFGGIVKEI